MNVATLIDFTNRGLLLALWVSLPTVAAAAAIGLLFALLQATTQLQDQTTGQIVKLVGACIVLALTGGWVGLSVLNFADELMRTGGFNAPTPIL
jgi:type III secretion protein S